MMMSVTLLLMILSGTHGHPLVLTYSAHTIACCSYPEARESFQRPDPTRMLLQAHRSAYKDDHSDLAALNVADIIPHHDLGNYKTKLSALRNAAPRITKPLTVLVVKPPELTSDAVIKFERLSDGRCVFNIFGNNLWNIREMQVVGLNACPPA